jgi:hypothetical protein
MGVLQRFERRLGGVVEGLFARAFKSEVQPVEVAAALQRELDAQAAVVARDRILVPNRFVVDLGDHDFERLSPYEKPLTDELVAMVREHADDQRYTFVGKVAVTLNLEPTLDTGVFHVHSEVVAGPDVDPPLRREPESAPKLAPRAERAPLPPAAVPPTAVPPTHAPPTAVHPGYDQPGYDQPRRPMEAPVRARLVVREGKDATYTVELSRPVTVIGRGADADVRLGDSSVSRRHAEIHIDGRRITVHDLQSTNGTRVNGARVTTTTLVDGDELRVGETVLMFREVDAAGPNAGRG